MPSSEVHLLIFLVAVAFFFQHPVYAADEPAQAVESLDGLSFSGRLRGKGMLAVFGSKVVLEFSHGIFTWVNGEDFEPAKYEATISDNKVYFSVHAVGRQGGDFSADYVDWSGSFDGKTLNDVTAVWTRNGRGNWLYNFLLPDVVRFKFKQKGEFRHSDFGSD